MVLWKKELKKVEKNCLFMHEGVIVTQTSDMLYFQGQFLIPEELQNCKLKKTCYSACVHKEILIFHGVTEIADTSKIKNCPLDSFEDTLLVTTATFVGVLQIPGVYLPSLKITVSS